MGKLLEHPKHAIEDSLKKVRYLLKWHPRLFGIRAIGYAADFRVEYVNDGTIRLEPLNASFREALLDWIKNESASTKTEIVPSGQSGRRERALPISVPTPPHQLWPGASKLVFEGVDQLSKTLIDICPEIDIDPGTGKTAFNAYARIGGRPTILLGLYQNGDMWTDLKNLSDEECEMLISTFASLGIHLDIKPKNAGQSRGGPFWRVSGQKANWRYLQPVAIAGAIRKFLEGVTR